MTDFDDNWHWNLRLELNFGSYQLHEKQIESTFAWRGEIQICHRIKIEDLLIFEKKVNVL
jgi:hypothetical protein